MKTVAILVEGTFGGDWARPQSLFARLLRESGIEVVHFKGWTTNLDGVKFQFFQKGKHRSWIAGGEAFADKVRVVRTMFPGCRVVVVCHSHGLNVVLYGVVRHKDISIDRLVSVCSPVRKDMQHQANGAVKRIGRWRHVAAKDFDLMQAAGEWFDGVWGWRERKWKQAHENLIIPGIGHSKLLNDLKFLDLWSADGMIDFLLGVGVKGAEVVGR